MLFRSLPWLVSENGYLLRVMTLLMLFAAMAQSWNIVGGLANQISLGHAAFFGLGAYTSTILLIRVGLSPWLGVVAGMLVAAAAGALLSRQSSSVQTIDFVNPRRAPEKRDLRRVKVLGGALAAVVLFAGIWSYRQGRIADLTGQKSRWDADNAEIRERLQAGEKDLEWADKDRKSTRLNSSH